jgi:Protein of unknown function (DUF2971)
MDTGKDIRILRARIRVNGAGVMPKAPSGKLNRHFVMDRWLDILKDEPPRMVDAPILHHYTDAFGAHGIISSNCLWATATQFSNDFSEIEYAVSIATEIIEEMWGSKKHISSWEQILAGHLAQLFATPLHTFGQPFIVSFCEDGDLLSQWRAYGRTSGFSFGFSPLSMNDEVRLTCKKGFRTMVKRVVYDPAKQRARFRFIVTHLIKLVNGFSFAPSSSEGASAHVELSLLLILEMTDWACAVKHKAFSEEKEWRIITYPKDATMVGAKPENYEGVSVRPTSKLLLPYMILEATSGKRLPLVEIRCGPSQFQEQSARAMNILLRNYGYDHLPVTFSGVPLRV